MPEEPTRQLAAIMFADIVGYTALMQEDDANPMPGLDNDAAVQVEAAQNAVKQEDETEGEEAANPKDVEKVLDLANSMKKTGMRMHLPRRRPLAALG